MATLAGILQLCAIMHDRSDIATSAINGKHQRVGRIGVYDIGIIVGRYAKFKGFLVSRELDTLNSCFRRSTAES